MALRSWDDCAKVPGLDVPGQDYYRPMAQGIAQHWRARNSV